MLKTILLSAVVSTSPATEATPPGEPFSPERHAYCEAQRNTCEQGGVAACTSDSPPGCADDALTWCSKEFTTCFEYGGEPPTPALPPALPPSLPVAPAAPAKCSALFSLLRQYARAGVFIRVVWTTNYQANEQLYAGRTSLVLLRNVSSRRSVDLYGQGTRKRTNYSGGGPAEEKVSLRIRADGKIMLSDIYGPYDVVCSAGRFAVTYTGDSVEVFNFTLP